MGNTVLAHVLYASNSKHLDLNTFFSATGNAHKIIYLNKTEITAEHLQETPNENRQCIIELVSDNWFQVLKFKMSYAKWYNDFPTRSNFTKFFKDVQVTSKENTSWVEFYNNVKDPSWPNCDSYKMIHTLDHQIQQEILQIYQPPSVNLLESDSLFLEVLSQTYFNMLTVPYKKYFDTAEVYHISDYFLEKITPLENICTKILGRKWDQRRSNEFFKKVIEVNSRYFAWLHTIKEIYQKTIEFVEVPVQLELWEQALIIAKCCEYFKISPMNLKWYNADCFFNENNVVLIELLKRINHGKTI